MFKEFKEFIQKGNVMDLAVAVIIGGAFGKIVSSLVDDVVMPVVSLATGKVDFTNLFVTLNGQEYATLEAAKEAGAATLNYGSFIQQIINFLIIAFVVFIMVKSMNKLRKEEPEAEPTTKVCPFCQTDVPIKAVRCPHCTSELE
ncbi:MAG: large conductance mechanosensitive channel protein MscL [Tissierellia bacterium]|nr:large conductance mechanosensitive channel protein MscL [Tissierellia bacterium]